MQLSRFAAFYPKVLAKAIAKAVMLPEHTHVSVPAMMIVEDCHPVRAFEANGEDQENHPKRAKHAHAKPSEKGSRKRAFEELSPQKLESQEWKDIMNAYRRDLPKSGIVSWDGPDKPEVQAMQKQCPDMNVQAVLACKGREKYMIHPDGLPHHRTIILSRLAYEVFDLGTEDLQGLSRNQQTRKAPMSAHVMVCVFGRIGDAEEAKEPLLEDHGTEPGIPDLEMPAAETTADETSRIRADSVVKYDGSDVPMPANSWTSAAVSVSGPKFLQLSEPRKAYIRKLHHNLGHPTAERLSRHLADLGAEGQLVQGALDYLCASCVERRPPKLNPTGSLKEARDFNHRLYIDGFDWKGSTGYQGYVVHIIDEATQFHLGRRTVRDGIQAQKVFDDCWGSWAGSPSEVVMDCGGEFVAEPWKDFLQKEGSITSDESTSAHLHAALNEGPDADRFRRALELRVLARRAFVESDNSQSIRRAVLRKSRGEITEWQCGQPCMFWDKRKSVNMLEKGRWCGPAQVVLVESKTIVWITHMNRLLRVARDNLRPVSLREFERHTSFNQQIDVQRAQQLAQQLQRRLHERSGMFQFSDLSDVPSPEIPQGETTENQGIQPEEEPTRRASIELRPEEVAIPEIPDEAWEDSSVPSPSSFGPEAPDHGDNVTGSNDGDNLSGDGSIEDTHVIYNAYFTESNVPGPAIQSDEDTLWDPANEDPRPYCEYEFEVPEQQVQRFLGDPKIHTSFLATAARRARSEVRFATLSDSEKEQFRRSDGRQLAMEPVAEMKQLLNMSDSEVLMLDGNAYGRVDAPLLFYKEFRRQLDKVGFEAHPLDGCLFLLRNKENPEELDGILGTHVDDGIGGGNENYEKALTALQKVLPFGQREFRRFRFTGLDIEQLPDHSIKISQEAYVHKIESIQIPKNRRSNKNEQATPQEVQDLRALCGSLQYAAVHSRPDLAAKIAFIQKNICKATVSTLLDANRVLLEAQQTADTSILVRPLPLERVTFASFGDASFASASQLRAQQGVFIVACTPDLADNQSSDISPMSWNSKQIGRVVRSTLSAEAYAMSSSLDKLTWLRCLWGFILNPKFKWQYPESSLRDLPKALLITDCKSLYDLVTKLAVPNCEEWRTTVEVMLIKQQSEGHSQCRWISTAIMLADSLTKPMDSSFLRSVLRLGRFRIFDENMTLQNNTHRKLATKWVSLPDAALQESDSTDNSHPKEK
eukprot:s424_g7.t1